MKTNLLRQKILDLAIRGKLVPQDPNDEPASVLLERIRAEKERLIAEGKIKRPKKSKASSAVSHYQQFEIPDTWKWTTLEELIILISGQDFPSDKYSSTPKGVPYIIGASNIQNGKVVVTRWTESPTVLSEKNDLLIICKGAGIGKMGINQIGTSHIARQLQALRPFSCYVSLEYIRVALMNGIEIICSQANGLIPGLSRDLLLKFPIPLPPLAEQMKIVNRVASALDNINVLEMEAAAAQDYISLLKSKILDLAMQGKLVPQNPNDEPAADMLRRINPKTKIITDNPHYPQLPDNWALIKLGDVAKVINGKSQKEVENPYGLYPIYGSGGIIGMADTYSCLAGSTIIGRKGTINNPLLIETNFWNVDTAFGMKPNEAVHDLYFYYFCKSFDFTSLDKSSTLPSLTKSTIENITMPIPPLKEQHRIVSKIKEYGDLLHNIIRQLGQK